MKAVQVVRQLTAGETRSVNNLEYRTIEKPSILENDEVLVEVAACGVCYRDLIDRSGGFPHMQLPMTPGHEFAGVVTQIGPKVTKWKAGDRVANLHNAPCLTCKVCLRGDSPRCPNSSKYYGMLSNGGYAEFVVAAESSLVPVPGPVSLLDACFLNCTAAVALRALRTRARLLPGDRLLITGASGGVGLHALQIGRFLGASWVGAVTSSADKRALLLEQGADEVLVAKESLVRCPNKPLAPRYNHPDLLAVLQLTSDGKFKPVQPVDVVLELVGAPTFESSLRALAPSGRLVVVGNVSVGRGSLSLGHMILQEQAVIGSAGSTAEDLATVLAWVAEGRLRPARGRLLPLAEAYEEQMRMDRRAADGRAVLSPKL